MTIAIDCLESRSSFNRRGREESLRNSRRIENIMSTTFVYIVLIAFAANLLSVSGLRCHQCNSHDNDDCASLVVNTPRAQRDEQYLKECANAGELQAFCRKTVIKLDVNDEHRIERSCGFIAEKSPNSCFTADNEGYKQIICTCKSDACNAATPRPGSDPISAGLATMLALTVCAISVLRH